MPQFFDSTTLAWLGGISVAMFVVTIVSIPIVAAWLPADYFVRPRRKRKEVGLANWVFLAAKNVVGAVMILAGVAMLVLPGQGLLTILLGLLLMNFPGKRRMERWLVSRPRVLSSLNWMRAKLKHPPLVVDESPHSEVDINE